MHREKLTALKRRLSDDTLHQSSLYDSMKKRVNHISAAKIDVPIFVTAVISLYQDQDQQAHCGVLPASKAVRLSRGTEQDIAYRRLLRMRTESGQAAVHNHQRAPEQGPRAKQEVVPNVVMAGAPKTAAS